MRGAVDDIYVRAYKGEDLIVESVPAALEVRQKAAERILKYYTDSDAATGKSENGVIIIPAADMDKLQDHLEDSTPENQSTSVTSKFKGLY
jgi:hypothetical protein